MVLQCWRMQGIICCKVNTSYTLEEVHELIAETSNPKSPSIHEGGPSTSKSLNNECSHPKWCPIDFVAKPAKGNYPCTNKSYIGMGLRIRNITRAWRGP
jgi:hypothetical protein